MTSFLRRTLAAQSAFLVLFLGVVPAGAATIHVSIDGTGDGTSEATATSIEDAMDSAQAGDEVVLHAGYYGDLVLSSRKFAEETHVVAAEGQDVHVRTLAIEGSENLTVSGLSVSLSHADSYERDTMVTVGGGSSSVTVSDCDIFSVPDSEIGAWSANDWAELPGTAVSVRSADIAIVGNRIRNVGHGISVNYDAPRATVSYNHIQNFSRDGLRGVADEGLFEYNTVLDAYDVDDHHDDFFQSWSYEDGVVGTTVVRGVVLRGNLFVNFTDPERPFAGAAQGIGCFDGFFEDWVVENNVIVVNHWHGITFLGARNMRIVNNTVLDNRLDDGPGPPWIEVSAHKNGEPSSEILIRNNLAQDINLEAENSTEVGNMIFDEPGALFIDHLNFDLRLLPGAEAIDVGTDDEAPRLDFDRILRPQGRGIDVGAFEWHDGSAEPVGSPPPSVVSGSGGSSAGSVSGDAGAGHSGGHGDNEGSRSDPGSGDGGQSGESAGCSCRQGGGPDGASSRWMLMLSLALGICFRARRFGASA